VDLVVVGAGIGGLAFGLVASRDGHHVTILERDGDPPPTTADEAFGSWARPGTPQARLHHTFLPRAHRELSEHAPDVLADALTNGVLEAVLPLAPDPADRAGGTQPTALASRRPVVEWCLRRAVEASSDIDLRRGAAAEGLVVGDGAAPHVVGVGCAGEPLPADLVVDAAGRRSPVRAWLRSAGAEPPPQQRQPCGIAYSSRYFRLQAGAELPPLHNPIVERGDLGFLGYAMGPADSGTYSVLFSHPADDRELRGLKHREAWDRAAGLIDRTAVFVDPAVGEPLMDPAPMYGLENVLNAWTPDGDARVAGLAPVGDAWSTTDPLFGWGASFALAHGFGLAGALRRHPSDVGTAVEDYHAGFITEVQQRFELSCEDDRARVDAWSPESIERSAQEIEREELLFGIGRLARSDPAVALALASRIALLSLPEDIYGDPSLIDRARTELAKHPYDRTRRTAGPSREEFVAALGPSS
jgi:2-polyprenyl-6-methoxyphenol hydroxylase-like FAD-dependent oxidoreductase